MFCGSLLDTANLNSAPFAASWRADPPTVQFGGNERHNSAIINGSRRKRIALGSGTTVQEVNNSSASTPKCPNSSKAWAAA
jgi:hypothetical protein